MQAVIPAGGIGKRLKPLTNTISKEMVLIKDRPVIDHVIEEAYFAGIHEFIVVVNGNKKDLIQHLQYMQKMNNDIKIEMVYQDEPMGLGHAVYCAKDHLRGPFAVLLADNIFPHHPAQSPLTNMLYQHKSTGHSIILIMPVPIHKVKDYGIVEIRDSFGFIKIKKLIEKPKVHEAPSNLAITGRYILTPAIIPILEQLERGYNNEIQLTDGLDILAKTEPVYGFKIIESYHDCGNVPGLLACMRHFKIDLRQLPKQYGFLQTYIKNVA